MKRVILDENLPVQLRLALAEFEVVTVWFMGWAGVKNGELISLADGKFDVFVTSDGNLRYQQNLKERKIAIIEVPFLKRNDIPRMKERIAKAISVAGKGDYVVVGM